LRRSFSHKRFCPKALLVALVKANRNQLRMREERNTGLAGIGEDRDLAIAAAASPLSLSLSQVVLRPFVRPIFIDNP
jgi:hypothetical protein